MIAKLGLIISTDDGNDKTCDWYACPICAADRGFINRTFESEEVIQIKAAHVNVEDCDLITHT